MLFAPVNALTYDIKTFVPATLVQKTGQGPGYTANATTYVQYMMMGLQVARVQKIIQKSVAGFNKITLAREDFSFGGHKGRASVKQKIKQVDREEKPSSYQTTLFWSQPVIQASEQSHNHRAKMIVSFVKGV